MRIDVYVNDKDLLKALKKGEACCLECELQKSFKYTQKINVKGKHIFTGIHELKVWMDLED